MLDEPRVRTLQTCFHRLLVVSRAVEKSVKSQDALLGQLMNMHVLSVEIGFGRKCCREWVDALQHFCHISPKLAAHDEMLWAQDMLQSFIDAEEA